MRKREYALDPVKLLRTAQYTLLVLLLVTSGLYVHNLLIDVGAAYFNGQPLTFSRQPWTTQDASGIPKMTFHPGETVYADVDFRVGFTGELRTMQQITRLDDNQARKTPDTQSTIAAGQYQATARITTLPADLAPGRYRIEGVTMISNWLRSFAAGWRTADFDVTAPG